MSAQPLAYDAQPDEDLVRRTLAGDETALTTLYHRYVAAIYRFVQAQVRDTDEAEDLTAETFARMLRGLAGFRGEASFRNWLYQIARNLVRNHRQSSTYRRVVPLSGRAAPLEGETEAGEDDASLALVVELLRPLPPRYRRVLELRFLENQTIEETAALLGLTVANAKVLQHRALRKAATMAEASIRASG